MKNFFFIKKYYPETSEIIVASLRRNGFNFTPNSSGEMDFSIGFGY